MSDSLRAHAPIGNQSPPLLLSAADLANLLNVSIRTIWRRRDMGHLPKEVEFGGAIRWRKDEIERWVRSGCVVQQKWTEMERIRKGAEHDAY